MTTADEQPKYDACSYLKTTEIIARMEDEDFHNEEKWLANHGFHRVFPYSDYTMTMRFGEKENGKVQKYVNPHVPVYKNECVSITIWRVMREETNSQSTSHSWSCRFSLCQDAQLQKIVESIGGDVFKQPRFVSYSPFGREWSKFCNVRRGDVFAQQIYNRLEDAIEFNYKTPKSVFETFLYKIVDTIEKATEIYSSHPQEYWDENVFV